jgi:tRNA pseudouridine13 synthase
MIEQLALQTLPYLTADLPGIGGQLKRRPEDFIVTEVPQYEPRGEGEYLYLWIEKRRRLTTDITRLIAEHFGLPMEAVGFAGLKDKHAITRQAVTVPGSDLDHALAFRDSAIRVVWAEHHDRPIRRGHLLGNRFDIKVREVDGSAVVRAKRVMDALVRQGVPNFAGEQRFGYRRTNHVMGIYLLKGMWQAFLDELLGRPVVGEPEHDHAARHAYEAGQYAEALGNWTTVHRFERQAVGPLMRGAGPEDAINAIDLTQRQLLISAFQSSIFNRVVRRRMDAGTLDQLVAGDVMYLHDDRTIRRVEDVDTEQARCAQQEVSATGPMWGSTMVRAGDAVDALELEELERTGVTLEELGAGKYGVAGSRKPLRMFVHDAEVSGGSDEYGPYVRCQFQLPRGCFATVVMGEVMKNGD